MCRASELISGIADKLDKLLICKAFHIVLDGLLALLGQDRGDNLEVRCWLVAAYSLNGRLTVLRSAEQSHRRKSDPYRSAMSMLTFYVNRAGKGLSRTDRMRLDKAKDELRKAFDRSPAK